MAPRIPGAVFEEVGGTIRERVATDPLYLAALYGFLAAVVAFVGAYLLTGLTIGEIAPWQPVGDQGRATVAAAALESLLVPGVDRPVTGVPGVLVSALAIGGVASRFVRESLDRVGDDDDPMTWSDCAVEGLLVVPTYLVGLGIPSLAVGGVDLLSLVAATAAYAALGGIVGRARYGGMPVTTNIGAGVATSVVGLAAFALTYAGGLAVRAPSRPVGTAGVPAWMVAAWLYLRERGFGLTTGIAVSGTSAFEILGVFHSDPVLSSLAGLLVAFLAATVIGTRYSNRDAKATDGPGEDDDHPLGRPLLVGFLLAVGWLGADVGVASVTAFEGGMVVYPRPNLASLLQVFVLSTGVAAVGFVLGRSGRTFTDAVRTPTSRTEFVNSLPEPDPRAAWRAVRAWIRSFVDFTFRRPVDRIYLLGIALSGSYIYYAALGAFPMLPWDEGVYANAARSMLRGHLLVPRIHWLVHSVSEIPFLEKPPLTMWSQALSMSVFGINPFGARFPSATAVVLTAVALYLFGRAVHSRRAGLAMGVVYLTTTHLYAGINAGRMGTTDTTLAFFGTVFVCGTWLAVTREQAGRWFVVANVAAAGAVLTKGFAAAPFLLAVLPVVMWRWRAFNSRSFAKAVGVGTALILPWFLYAWATHPDELLAQLWTEQVYRRAVGDFGPDASNTLFAFMRYPYFGNLNALLDPWGYVLAAAVPVGLYRAATGDSDRGRTLLYLWWATSIFGFYVILGMYSWYVIPMYAPLAMFLGEFVADALGGDLLARSGVAVGALATFLFSARFAVWVPTGSENLGVYPTAPPSGLPALVALLVGTTAVVGGPSLRERYRSLATDGGGHETLSVALVLLFVVTATAPVPVNDTVWHRSQGPFGQLTHETVPSDEAVYMHESVLENAAWFGFQFYADRDLRQATLAEMNDQGEVRYAIVREVSLVQLDRSYDVLTAVTMPEQPRFDRGRRQLVLLEFSDRP